jgi:hypothetical protein
MRWTTLRRSALGIVLAVAAAAAQEPQAQPGKLVEGVGPGWRELGEADFVNVNCAPDTWTWKDGTLYCTGQPVGVIRTKTPYRNFELVATWRHRKPGGNSGIFVWAPEEALKDIEPGKLPRGGIEVQVLDNAFTEQYEKRSGRKGDFFTTHGDVFAVGTSKFTPFEPTSPDGSRSFPKKRLSKGVDEWNHYYVRAVDGEVRLSVNGEEVSGGKDCRPSSGYLCLESEGSPVEFKDVRIRELP